MGPTGFSIGFFSPQGEIGDVVALCERILEICGPASAAFPLAIETLKNEDGSHGLSFVVSYGPVPIHIERPRAAVACSTVFTFVLATENRPAILYAPAGQRESECIFSPEEARVPTMALGCVEMVPGKALYFDVARGFHGITALPTGDPTPDLPRAIMVRVPWPRKEDIGGALNRMKSLIRADARFADLVAQ